MHSRIGWVYIMNGHSSFDAAQCKASGFVLFVLKDGHTSMLQKKQTWTPTKGQANFLFKKANISNPRTWERSDLRTCGEFEEHLKSSRIKQMYFICLCAYGTCCLVMAKKETVAPTWCFRGESIRRNSDGWFSNWYTIKPLSAVATTAMGYTYNALFQMV